MTKVASSGSIDAWALNMEEEFFPLLTMVLCGPRSAAAFLCQVAVIKGAKRRVRSAMCMAAFLARTHVVHVGSIASLPLVAIALHS